MSRFHPFQFRSNYVIIGFMSESGSDDELEFDGVRSRLESGFYPSLMGPGPELTLALALALSQPILWLVPEAPLFLACAVVFFVTATIPVIAHPPNLSASSDFTHAVPPACRSRV